MRRVAVCPTPPAAIGALAPLHAAAFADSGEGGWSAEALTALLDGHGAYAFSASFDREIPGIEVEPVSAAVGFVIARAIAEEAEILTLAVGPQARRSGVGRALMQAACARAEASGATRMFLEVAEDNAPAQRLYAALGFVLVGRRPEYYQRACGARLSARVFMCALGAARAQAKAQISPESNRSLETRK